MAELCFDCVLTLRCRSATPSPAFCPSGSACGKLCEPTRARAIETRWHLNGRPALWAHLGQVPPPPPFGVKHCWAPRQPHGLSSAASACMCLGGVGVLPVSPRPPAQRFSCGATAAPNSPFGAHLCPQNACALRLPLGITQRLYPGSRLPCSCGWGCCWAWTMSTCHCIHPRPSVAVSAAPL